MGERLVAHSAEYTAVLASEEWRALSFAVRSVGVCEACRTDTSPADLQLHHWHYGRLGNEGRGDHWDVSALCLACHTVADRHRRQIVAAAKRYAARHGDPHWRRAAHLLGREFVAVVRRPAALDHHTIALRGLACLLEDYP